MAPKLVEQASPCGSAAPMHSASGSRGTASMLTAIYFMLRDGVDYRDLGHDYFDRIDKKKAAKRLVRRLNSLGYDVDLKVVAA
jgi:hypothetical protein